MGSFRKHGYMTAGDFVLGRYGNRGLELAVALTGILATMPYIALQLVGLEKIILALGVTGNGIMAHAPLTIAFVILALYTYRSGLRAPSDDRVREGRHDLYLHHRRGCRHPL